MSALLRKAARRHFRKHPLLAALSLLGVALGVAVVVAIDLANESAWRAFSLSQSAVMGAATQQIVGGPAGLDETLFVRLRRDLGLARAAPIVEGYVTSPRAPGQALRVVGVDPFSEAPFRSYISARATPDFATLLTRRSALLAPGLAARVGIRPGDGLSLLVSGRTEELLVAGLLEPSDAASASALEDVLLCDISTAQELLGERGRLTRIDLILPDSPAGERTQASIRAACGNACDILPAASRSVAAIQMTRAFRLNLGALGLLALVVGMFLTYNTMTFLVALRRALFGTLRAMGVTRLEVFGAVIADALAVAIPATVLGAAGGILLASGLTRLVSRTINDLYFVVNVRSLSIEPATLVKAAGLGIGATVVAALVPAWEATRVPPSLTLRRSPPELALLRRSPALALLGLAFFAAAALLVAVSRQSLLAALGALFGVLLGAALLVPLALRALTALYRPVAGRLFGFTGRMAAQSLSTSLTRSSVAVAALMVAVATTVGVGLMVDSFRAAVADWLGASLRSDIFVQLPNVVSRKGEGTIAPEVVRRIAACPGVAAVNSVRNRRVRTSLGDVDLHAASYGDPRARRDRFRAGRADDVYRELDLPDAVAVSEPFAFRHALSLGSSFDIFTDHGARVFRVAGVYVDYASDEGGILMSRASYEIHFDDRAVSALGLVAQPGEDPRALIDRVKECAGGEQALSVRAQRELRDASLAIFDRTFVITRVLRLLSVVVAFVGILSALSALALERARELAVLRALGMTPRQVRGFVTLQTALLGLSAGLFSIPLGFALAFLLVHVINRRSFGWALDLALSPDVAVEALLLSILAALLAGLYPAWKMSRASPAAALRDE